MYHQFHKVEKPEVYSVNGFMHMLFRLCLSQMDQAPQEFKRQEERALPEDGIPENW